MPEISIIVPIYNAENHLKKCIDSIIDQSFKALEIILVDDGSTDSSPKICDEYSIKDDRIKVIHKKNGGLSDARNTGIELSTGNFLSFIDSDDYVDDDMCKTLYDNIVNNNADLSVCGVYECYGDKIISKQHDSVTISRTKPNEKLKSVSRVESSIFVQPNVAVFESKKALELVLIGNQISNYSVAKLYKKSLFNNIKFPIGKLYEDSFVTPKIIVNSKKVVVTPEPKYYYVRQANSITTSDFKLQDLDIIEAGKTNLDFVKNNFPYLKSAAIFRYLWSYMHVLDKMILSENSTYIDEYKKTISTLRKNIFKILFNKNFTRNRKISMLALLFSTNLYEKITTKYYINKFS